MENQQTLWEFFKSSYSSIITFIINTWNRLIGIKNIKFDSYKDINTSGPILCDFLIGALCVLILFSFISYFGVVFRFIVFIFKSIYNGIKLFFQAIFFIKKTNGKIANTITTKTTTTKTNKPSKMTAKEKAALVKRLQDGKEKKRLEKEAMDAEIKKMPAVKKTKGKIK